MPNKKKTAKRKQTRKRFSPFEGQVTVYQYLEHLESINVVDENDVFNFIKKFEKKLNYPLDHQIYFKRVYELFEKHGTIKVKYYLQNLDKLSLDPRSYINKFFDFKRKLENNILGGV